MVNNDIYEILDELTAFQGEAKGAPQPALMARISEAAFELLADLDEVGVIILKTPDDRTVGIDDMTLQREPRPAVVITVARAS